MKRQPIRKALILISFTLFPITLYYFSPYLIIEGASQGIMVGSTIVFTTLFFVSMILGRLFCSWLCPAGGLQEACFMVQNKRANNKYNWTKFLIWVPWIIMVLSIIIVSGGYRSIDPFYKTTHGISVYDPESYIVYFTVVGLILIMALTAGKRGFCHHVCWISPFMIIGRKIRNIFRWPALQLKADKSKCISCLTCTKNCPKSLEVNQMVQTENMENSECILCATCIDGCTKGVIRYSF